MDISVFDSAMAELFLEKFNLEELAHMPLKEFTEFLQEKRKNRFGNPKCIASSIQKAVKVSYRSDKSQKIQ